MNSILYIKPSKSKNVYNKNNILSKISDRFKINIYNNIFLKDLNLNIFNVNFPLNIDVKSYNRNMNIATNIINNSSYIAPKAWRTIDYKYFSHFQKDLLGYSIYKSIQLILRLKNKSIRNSCIVIYDPIDEEILSIIRYICIKAKYIVFLTQQVERACKIREYIVANYGTSPIITRDSKYAFNNGDFIVASRPVPNEINVPVWYLDNLYIPDKNKNIIINDVYYETPWKNYYPEISIELLGAILSQMEEKSIENSLKYNGFFINKMSFNDKEVKLL